jgi:hypothetical protein
MFAEAERAKRISNTVQADAVEVIEAEDLPAGTMISR